ncbi:MAG: type II toxin-antitoxin system HicB family antitoxin [Clostridia bacterium]|nr:type II toxin-antitoxin system HicB family antitoxin [Clostridia bacterium]
MEAKTYPALLRRERCGLFSVHFPDLDCAVCGETLDEAMDMARDTLAAWIRRVGTPAPSDLEEIRKAAKKGDLVMLVEERCSGDTRLAG